MEANSSNKARRDTSPETLTALEIDLLVRDLHRWLEKMKPSLEEAMVGKDPDIAQKAFETVLKSSLPRFRDCTSEQCREIFKTQWETSPRVTRAVEDFFFGDTYERFYRPTIPQATQSLIVARRILSEKMDPYELHVYWRATIRNPANTRSIHHFEVVRYSLELEPLKCEEDDSQYDEETMQYATVHRYCQWQTYFDHSMGGPLEVDRFVDPDDDDFVDLYGCVSKLLSTYVSPLSPQPSTSNQQYYSALDDGRHPDDTWDSVEVVMFTSTWYPELHSQTPLDFQAEVRQLLLVNQRLPHKMTSECIKHVVRMLYLMHNEAPRIPLVRIIQHPTANVDYAAPPGFPARQLVNGISELIGMGSPKTWATLDEEEQVPCQAREDCSFLFNGGRHSVAWTASGNGFIPPLVFRF